MFFLSVWVFCGFSCFLPSLRNLPIGVHVKVYMHEGLACSIPASHPVFQSSKFHIHQDEVITEDKNSEAFCTETFIHIITSQFLPANGPDIHLHRHIYPYPLTLAGRGTEKSA